MTGGLCRYLIHIYYFCVALAIQAKLENHYSDYMEQNNKDNIGFIRRVLKKIADGGNILVNVESGAVQFNSPIVINAGCEVAPATIQPDLVSVQAVKTELPLELSTPKAMQLWEKTQEVGYVDADYQPCLSRTQAALLANAMARRLGIKNKWKVFETLWNRRNMYRDFHDAILQRQSLDFQDKLKELFL